MSIVGNIIGVAGGGGFQLFVQKDNQPGEYADSAARDTYFGANPDELARLDQNQFLIIKLNDDGTGKAAYQQRASSQWIDVTSLIQGETGPAGATGNSYFFNSIAERDTFFGTSPNEALLENGLPVVANVGDETASTFIWGGPTTPVLYDPELWRLASVEVNAGTLILGPGGANISSGNIVLDFVNAEGRKSYVNCVSYDDTGSDIPFYWEFASKTTITLADVFDTALSDPQTLSFTTTNDSMVTSYTIIPASSGDLRVQGWIGTDETGPNIFDAYFTVLPGDIDNETEFEIPNDIFIEGLTDTYTKFSGVQLKGGLQTSGPFVGQTTIFVKLDRQLAVKRQSVCIADGEVLTSPTLLTGDGDASIKNIDNTSLTNDGTTLSMDLTSPSATGSVKIDLLDSLSNTKLNIEYDNTNDRIEFLTTAPTMIFGSGPSAGLIEFLSNDSSYRFETGGTSNIFELDFDSLPDTNPIMRLFTGGTNGGTIDFHVGSRFPEGNITADGGAIYFRDSGISSDLYLKRTDGGNTGWIDFLHAASGVIGPSLSTINSLATWGDTTGNTLLDVSNITATETTAISNISLTSPDNPGEAQIYFYDELSTLAGSLIYSAGTESMVLASFSDGDMIITSSVSDILIRCNTSSSEVIVSNISNDTFNVMSIQTEGTNGAKAEFFTGNRDPNGNVTSNPGGIYYEISGANSAIHQYRSASAGNTSWIELGDVRGQSISTNNALTFFSGTSGKRIDSSSNILATISASATYLDVKSPQATSTGSGYRLLDSSGSVAGEFIYDENNDFVYLRDFSANGLNIHTDDGEVTFTAGASSSAISLDLISPSATGFSGLVLSNNVGTTKFTMLYVQAFDFTLFQDETSGGLTFSTDSQFTFSGQGLNDTDTFMKWSTTGTNPGVIDIYLTNRNPEGNISAIPGAVAFRQDGLNSDIYIHRSTVVSNTGWVDILTTGIKTDETSTINNSLATWDGTTADKIKEVPGITAIDTGSIVGITLEIPNALDIAELTFADENGIAEMEFVYDDSNNLTSIVSNTTDFKIEATSGSMEINTASGQNVTINENLRFFDNGTTLRIDMDTPVATGSSRIRFNNATGTQIGRLLYNENTDVIDLEVLDTSTTLNLISSQQPINFTVNQLSAARLLILNNDNVNIGIFGRQLSPQAQVSGIPGDLTILADERQSSLYMRRDTGAATTGTSWAEVQFVQRKYEDVSTTQTLQRNASVILAIPPSADIDITLPTNASTAEADGFTQTITKGITNDHVVTIVQPGFYGHTGDFVLSRRGDSVTYMQDSSANIVLGVNRQVFAIMSKGVAETAIAGDTGSEIIFTGFTNNEYFYYGLCEPDQANDKINFPNVENADNGDLYEVEFVITFRHSNNSLIEFFVTVDDSGIATNYPLHMRHTSNSSTNEVTLSGRTYIRTGINFPFDTDLQVFFTLPSANLLWSRRAYLKLTKVEGR